MSNNNWCLTYLTDHENAANATDEKTDTGPLLFMRRIFVTITFL